jgi:hypothetical protein
MKLNKGTLSSRRPVLVGVLVVAWLAILVGGAVPAWRRALQQHREVRQVEAQLVDLDQWTMAGLWLERSLAPRGRGHPGLEPPVPGGAQLRAAVPGPGPRRRPERCYAFRTA